MDSTAIGKSPNFSVGRNGRVPIAIVNHITAGLMPGCLNWLCDPQSQASAHYLVTRLGEIYQMVNDEDTAWHCGIVNHPSWPLYDGTNPNRYTLGIEHEGQPEEPLTDKQYQSSLGLHKLLIAKWGIPITADNIIGHYRIDSVNRPNCPGPAFPWNRLFNDLKGVMPMPDNNTPSDWAKVAWEWGIKNKVCDGTNPQETITREEVIQILYNLNNK